MTFWQRFQSQWRNNIRASTFPKVAGPKFVMSYATTQGRLQSKGKRTAVLFQKLESIVAYISDTLNSTLQLECTNPLREEFAITLATRLRVLLNDENKNKSLLSLLNIKKDFRFQGVKCDIMHVAPANMVYTSVLTSTVVSGDKIFSKANDFTPNEVIF